MAIYILYWFMLMSVLLPFLFAVFCQNTTNGNYCLILYLLFYDALYLSLKICWQTINSHSNHRTYFIIFERYLTKNCLVVQVMWHKSRSSWWQTEGKERHGSIVTEILKDGIWASTDTSKELAYYVASKYIDSLSLVLPKKG